MQSTEKPLSTGSASGPPGKPLQRRLNGRGCVGPRAETRMGGARWPAQSRRPIPEGKLSAQQELYATARRESNGDILQHESRKRPKTLGIPRPGYRHRQSGSPLSSGPPSSCRRNGAPAGPAVQGIKPSPALREREGPSAQRWEGEGLSVARTLTRPPLRVGHPLPRCGRGTFSHLRTSQHCGLPRRLGGRRNPR